MNLKNEPVRVIGYSATAGAILAAVGAYLIAKGYTAEGGLLVTVGGIVGGTGATEGKRALTDSPVTRKRQALKADKRASAPPPGSSAAVIVNVPPEASADALAAAADKALKDATGG